jgi:hypothetical protein
MARSSADFNRPYLKQEVPVALSPQLSADAPVLYPDGAPVGAGYTVPRQPAWNPKSTSHNTFPDKPGCVRIDITETLPVTAPGLAQLYFHKGGQGYLPATVPYGHLDASALVSPPPPRFTKDQIDADGADPGHNPRPGAGRAAPDAGRAYRVKPMPIGPQESEHAWLYKNANEEKDGAALGGARYSKYGDAGPVQGDPASEHFAYLCWSWMRQSGDRGDTVRGGGAIRTILQPGQVVHRCDVQKIDSPAWDRAGNMVGRVTAIYVRVPTGGTDLYGWMVHSHTEIVNGQAVRHLHVESA